MRKPRGYQLAGVLVGGLSASFLAGVSKSTGACSCATSYVGTLELLEASVEGGGSLEAEVERWEDGGLIDAGPGPDGNDVLTLYVSDFEIEAARRRE